MSYNSYNVYLYRRRKIIIDILFALFLLIAISPLFLFIYFVFILSNKTTKVITSSIRIGLYGRPFKIYKFKCENERYNNLIKFMVNNHLDYLPMLFNVIKCDISFVGYRPENRHVINTMIKSGSLDYYVLYNVRPGFFYQDSGRAQYNTYTNSIEVLSDRVYNYITYLGVCTVRNDFVITIKAFLNLLFARFTHIL